MLPTTSADGGSADRDHPRRLANVAFTTQTIKGVTYALFASTSGTYTATYTADTTPPVISSVAATADPERRRDHHLDDQRALELECCLRNQRHLARHHPI